MPADEQLNDFNTILNWCSSKIGSCKIVEKDSRFHGRTSVLRLQTPNGFYYLKLHKQKYFWENEIHAYEQWACALGQLTPRLLAIHETEPLALLMNELPGKIMDSVQLQAKQELKAWYSAGQALVRLHTHAQGTFLGPCTRDGRSAETPVLEAEEYIRTEFRVMLKKAAQESLLNEQECATVQAVQTFAAEFKGESPVPCHRDYGPANWLVTQDGKWTGVIDFEFSYWDVRVADFSRYPNWEWIHRPDLMEAFFDGYGRTLTAQEETQCILTRTRYALGAILWGHENAFYGFESEGRLALEHIRRLLG